jgi:hypothetical protein
MGEEGEEYVEKAQRLAGPVFEAYVVAVNGQREPTDTNIGDLISDLLLLADDPDEVLRSGISNFEYERDDEDEDDEEDATDG